MVFETLARIADLVKFSILNEPDMLVLNPATVNQWSKEAYAAVRKAGFTGSIVISDGFLAPGSFVGVFPQATYPRYIPTVTSALTKF
jgi:hypothetical protein